MCHAKYKTKYGVMVEIICGTRAMYALGELPPFDMQEIKLKAIEERFSEYKTPEELLAALPRVMPMRKADFFKAAAVKGHHAFDGEEMKKLPKLEWNMLYNMTKTAALPISDSDL